MPSGTVLAYVDEHPEMTHVIIYMRSRVFRNFTDAAVVKRELLSKGVKLVSAKEQFGDGYMGDAMEAITDIMKSWSDQPFLRRATSRPSPRC